MRTHSHPETWSDNVTVLDAFTAVHIHMLEACISPPASAAASASQVKLALGHDADQALPRRLHDSPISDESKKEPDSKQVGVHQARGPAPLQMDAV